MYDYCFRVRRTIKEVLAEFRSAKIPKEYIFDLFPAMRPREFSISSSIKVRHFNDYIRCVGAYVTTQEPSIPDTSLRSHRQISDQAQGPSQRSMYELHGWLASRYEKNPSFWFQLTAKINIYLALQGDSLRIGLRKGLITLPTDPDAPVICVGPGTGIAPMRAVIEDRLGQGSTRRLSTTWEMSHESNLMLLRKHALLWLSSRCQRSTLQRRVSELCRERGAELSRSLLTGRPGGCQKDLRARFDGRGRKEYMAGAR